MSHQHGIEKTYNDEELKGSITRKELPMPMGWKVLIQPNQSKSKTAGGIILPSKAKENEAYLTAHGEVCAIGELAYRDRETGQRWHLNATPKVGDRVTYGKYAGQKLIINNVRMLLLNDDEITAILPEGTEITAYV